MTCEDIGKHLRSQLGDSNTAIGLGQPIPILPRRLSELRAAHNDLAQRHAALGPNRLNLNMDPSVEAED